MKIGKILPLLVLACATPAHSFQFKTSDNIQSALDVTLIYGAQWRIDDPEKGLIADPNLDDANRNFDSGLVSNGIRAIVEFESRYSANNGASFGVFARASAWYDDEIYGARNDNDSPVTVNSWGLYGGTMDRHNEFHPDVEDRSGADVELLDLFLFVDLGSTGDHPATVRLGRQVVNWGESAFIQNGLSSVINPADVSKAVLPGTEVKEILRPLGALSGSIALNQNISLSAYYQYEWEETIAPPYGTFLSPVPDPLSGVGGEKFLLPVGAVAGQLPFPQDPSYFDSPFIAVDRDRDEKASDSGQWGASLSWYVPELNDTEFGFYVGNYHRKRPTINFTNYRGVQNNDWSGQCFANAGPAAGSCAILSLAATGFDVASYQLDYAEDIEYYGASWNTVIGWTDTAFSGEVIYHKDVPIQTISLLGGLVPTVVDGLPVIGSRPGEAIETSLFSRQDMVVTQVTFNQNFNPSWADDANLIVEVGHVYILDLDDDEVWNGNTAADTSSWGYRANFVLTWYDGIGKRISALTGTDLIWSFNFNHDVSGTSPVVGTGFTDGSMAFSTAVKGLWQNTWSVELAYTNFFGDGTNTLGEELDDHVMGDRDFFSLAVKYRF